MEKHNSTIVVKRGEIDALRRQPKDDDNQTNHSIRYTIQKGEATKDQHKGRKSTCITRRKRWKRQNEINKREQVRPCKREIKDQKEESSAIWLSP